VSDQARCISCRAEIIEGASICPTCKSYQSRWKNTLSYGATVASVIALVASAIAYVSSRFMDVLGEYTTAEGVTGSYISHPPLNGLFVNTGKGEAFVTHITINSPFSTNNIGMQLAVAPGKMAHVAAPEANSGSYLAVDPAIPEEGPRLADYLNYLANGDMSCLRQVFFSEDHGHLPVMRQAYEDAGKRLVVVPAHSAFLSFYSAKDGKPHQSSLRIVSVFSYSKECGEAVEQRLQKPWKAD
jgi:hypothetical protein